MKALQQKKTQHHHQIVKKEKLAVIAMEINKKQKHHILCLLACVLGQPNVTKQIDAHAMQEDDENATELTSTIDIIPDELFVTIFEYMGNDPKDIIQFSYTCRRFHDLSLRPEIWARCSIIPYNLLFKYFDVHSPLYFLNNETPQQPGIVHNKYQFIEQHLYLKKKEQSMRTRDNRKKWVHNNLDIVVGATHALLYFVLLTWTVLVTIAIARRPYFVGEEDPFLRVIFIPFHAAGVLSFIYVFIECVCMSITRINILPQITIFIIGVVSIWIAFVSLQEKVLKTFNVYDVGDNNIYWWQISFPITLAVLLLIPSSAWTWRHALLFMSGTSAFWHRFSYFVMLVIICTNCLFWPLFWDQFDLAIVKEIPNPVLVYLPLVPYAIMFSARTRFPASVRLAQIGLLWLPIHYFIIGSAMWMVMIPFVLASLLAVKNKILQLYDRINYERKTQ